MLDKVENIRKLLTARLEATSDGVEVDAICAAISACRDADCAIKRGQFQLAAAKNS
uniref:Glutamyl-tRNA amidotransferase n=1 Tax=Mesocestoides corti TaxID=53468 RepID=A0A5K3G2P7_MESCO